MGAIETKNARIESVRLTIEDHGCLSAWIHLDYGGGGQGFGGYALDRYDRIEKNRVGTAWGCEYVRRILEVLEIPTWEKLPGSLIRVRADHGKVHAIGHPLKDKWFDPSTDLDHLKGAHP